MNNKGLPIGTVLLLKGGIKKVMITGYNSISREDSDKIYDYNGCVFPEGFMENVFCLFNADQIEEIFYYGLDNDESKNYVTEQSLLEDTHNAKALYAGRYDKKANQDDRRRRVPKAPTKPMSSSEMKSKYGVSKTSHYTND